MANLEGKLSQYGTVVMYTEANRYLEALNGKLSEGIGTTLSAVGSYLSKYEVVDDLRGRLAEEWRLTQPPGSDIDANTFETILPLLSPDKSVIEILANNPSEYETLEAYMNNLADNIKGSFDPTLKDSFETSGSMSSTVYPIPQSSEKDPRRGGRLIVFEEFTKSVKDWLINNAILYGFTLYEDYGLYYVGFDEVKSLLTSNQKVVDLVNKFQAIPFLAGDIKLKADAVQKAKDPGVFNKDNCPLVWIEGWDTPAEYAGGAISPIKVGSKVSMNASVRERIWPIINSSAYKSKYTKGHRMIALVYVIKEGYHPDTRSYRTNNPGNIGNTDSGANVNIATLEDGMKKLMDYFGNRASGAGGTGRWAFGPQKISPNFSNEIHKAAANYNRPNGCLPGYRGNYQGELGYFTKVYATGARVGNGGISKVATIFGINGFPNVNGNTKLSDLLSFNNNSPINLG
tara:strand:+ start:653 stop:2026 length:1374 start_codon:yes stop_codon:yes gene_type:complete